MALVYSPEVPSGKATPQDAPPSPTLTNPDMILPRRPYSGYSSSPSPDRLPSTSSPTLRHADFAAPISSSSLDNSVDIGVATSVKMPDRAKPTAPSSFLGFTGYEHGAPLSDIGEEDTIASTTPKSKVTRQSRSPSPVEALSPSPAPRQNEHESLAPRRNSITATSDGSEDVDWENFDTSKMMSGRLAADVAKEQEREALESKRNSIISNTEGDEVALLNDRAEQILEDARKRLTHMEDNLSKARHSTLWSPRSIPNIAEYHHPAGSLYRSISLAGTGKRYSRPAKASPTHARGSSDTTPNSGLKRLSMVSEARAASAQGYSGKMDSPQSYSRSSPITRIHSLSPSSSQGVHSPLRVLEEEEGDSDPSTSKTSPDSHPPRGLGIDTTSPPVKPEPYHRLQSPTLARSASAASLGRPESAASTRSIRESMTDLRLRINDLKAKTKADKDRRRNVQSRNNPSPFTQASAEKWYTSTPEFRHQGSPTNANAGEGWAPSHAKQESLDAQVTPQRPSASDLLQPETPQTALPHTTTPTGRTDVNTPNLVRPDSKAHLEAKDSVLDQSQYEDAAQEYDDEDQVAESEEEQVYLNEVLEESLQDVEPDIPDIPDILLQEVSAERHEDRLDAFDYENMFLHSAMGNYRNSPSTDSDSSDADSIETSRADQRTPTASQSEEYEKNGTPEMIGDLDEVSDEDDTEIADQPPTPKVMSAPNRPWLKSSRSNSATSVSTEASFATATEGDRPSSFSDDEDEVPTTILGWGNDASTFPPPPITSPRRENAPSQSFPTPLTSSRVVSPTNTRSAHQDLRIATGSFGAHSNGVPTPVRSPANSLSNGSGISNPPSQKSQYSAQRTPKQNPRSSLSRGSDHPANTEILLESLIKLADPDFKVDPPSASTSPTTTRSQQPPLGTRTGTFADIDKDLVLALLREVGQVCNGVLLAEKRKDSLAVMMLRARMDQARLVLEGTDEGEEED